MLAGIVYQAISLSDAEGGLIIVLNEDKYLMGVGSGTHEDLDLEYFFSKDLSLIKCMVEKEPLIDGKRYFIPLVFSQRLLGIICIEGSKLEVSKNRELYDVFRTQITPLIMNSMFYQEILAREHEVITDPLTGLYNRRVIFKWVANDLLSHSIEPYPLSIVIFDIDDFKSVNDNYGHDMGDAVLREVGEVFHTLLRTTDLVKHEKRVWTKQGNYAIRYGGEEFLLILTHTDRDNAMIVAERIRANISSLTFNKGEKERDFKITISAGVSTNIVDENNYSTVLNTTISQADKALYKAKSAGKNTVEIY
jgi:diguanylate cyclase (GGDEF)-like protein